MHTTRLPALRIWPVALFLSMVLPVPQAEAQQPDLIGDGEINSGAEVGPGTCDPSVVGAEEVTTCRFPLLGADRGLPSYGLTAYATAPSDPANRTVSYRCYVEGDELVCPDLVPAYEVGLQRVRLPLWDAEVPATIEVDRSTDGVLGLLGGFARVPVGFTGTELAIDVYRSYRLAEDRAADLLLRRAGDDEILGRFPALESGADSGTATVVFPESGRWTLSGCAVDPDGTCGTEGYRRPFEAIDPDPIELIPGHNLSGAERIDVVFVGSGWIGSESEFVATARNILAVDQKPVPLAAEGYPPGAPDTVYDLAWGPFSIEPLAGKTHLFNFWYLGADVSGRAFERVPADGEFDGSGIDLSPLGLGSNVAVVTLSRNGEADGSRAQANLPSFHTGTELPAVDEIEFGSAYMPFAFLTPGEGATTMTHEIGHLFFGLADEYEEYGLTGATLSYPNCAADRAEAEGWWGDLVGELDPMFATWRAAMEAAGLWDFPESFAESFRVGYFTGGCYAVESTAVRPTEASLMNSPEWPVFGSVNRRRAGEILSLWSGRAVFDPALHAASVGADCRVQPRAEPDPAEPDEVSYALPVACTITVGPYLDRPDAVVLRFDATDDAAPARGELDRVAVPGALLDGSKTVACNWIEGGDGATISCPAVRVSRRVTAEVHLEAGAGDAIVDVVTLPHLPKALPPPTTTTMPPAGDAGPAGAASSDGVSPDGVAAIVAVGSLLLLIAGILGVVRRRRS